MKFNKKFSYLLIALAALSFSACKGGGAEFRRVLRSAARETAKKDSKGSPESKTKGSKQVQVAAITTCPDNAKILGAPPPSGTSQWCSLPTDDGKGSKHGEFRKWYDDGKNKIQAFYDHGKAHGKYIEWYPTGQKKVQGNYLNNEKSGRWIEWNPEGVKLSEVSYLNGSQNGKSIQWSRKGTIDTEGNYINGQKTGVWITYNINGAPKAKVTYKADKKHGPSEIYSRNGEIKKVETYFGDIPHGPWITFWPDGSKKLEGNYSKGQKAGPWISYSKDGSPRQQVFYNKDGTATKVASNERGSGSSGGGRKKRHKLARFGKGDILGYEPDLRRASAPQAQSQTQKPSNLSSGENWQNF